MKREFAGGVILGSVVATIVLVAASAWAGSGIGGVFNLGKKNAVDHQSTLVGNAPESVLKVQNTGDGVAEKLMTNAGVPPFSVSSGARVSNLNADLLDGLDSNQFLGSDTVVVAASKPVAAGELHTDFVYCPEGYEALSGGVYSDFLVVQTMDSYPIVNDAAPAVGQSGPADGWDTSAKNVGNQQHDFTWFAVCASSRGK